MMTELLGKSKDELREFCAALGEPAFRGAQIYHGLYSERKFNVAQITNLPAALRERLSKEARITLPEVKQRFASTDGSLRYLFGLIAAKEEEKEFKTENSEAAENAEKSGREKAGRLGKPTSVEAVFMPSEGRQTICVSTQAGCAVDCHFCLTAQLGLIRIDGGRDPGASTFAAGRTQGTACAANEYRTDGPGRAAAEFPAGDGGGADYSRSQRDRISPKHVTLSTSGIVPRIERLAQEKVRPKLAISLNASNDEQRMR